MEKAKERHIMWETFFFVLCIAMVVASILHNISKNGN